VLTIGQLITASASAVPEEQPVVEVFLPLARSIGMDMAFLRARGVVNEIYSGIGVRVVWQSARSAPPGCAKAPLHRTIVVALSPMTRVGISPQALAFSNPHLMQGPCVTLLMDRLEPLVQKNPVQAAFLMGHVLAHEIGHVLQGFVRHSEMGVMKDRWSEKEIMHMPANRLRFTAFDAETILDGLATRVRP
jgi:hypothetical protein